jgi:hypothetical protein
MRDLQQAFVETKKLSRPTLYRYRKQLVEQGKIQVQSISGHPPYNVYSVPSEHHPVVNVLQDLSYSPFNLGIDLDEIPWEDIPNDIGTPSRQKVIYKNPKTGATMILLNAPEGARDYRHIHLEANQWSYGIQGEAVRQNGTQWRLKNSVGYYPIGMPHRGDSVTKETLCLVFWDGPPTYTIVENDYVRETH